MIAKRRRKVECESQLKGKFCARRQFMLLSFCPFSFSTSLCLCLCAIAVDRRISVMPARRHRRKNQKRRQKIHWKALKCIAWPSLLDVLRVSKPIRGLHALQQLRAGVFRHLLTFFYFSVFLAFKETKSTWPMRHIEPSAGPSASGMLSAGGCFFFSLLFLF